MRFLINVGIAAFAVWVATKFPFDVVVTGGEGDTFKRLLVFLFIGFLLIVVRAILKPILSVLSLPLMILTLGLFSIVIAAILLWVAAWLSDLTSFANLSLGSFWQTVGAALVIAVITSLLSPLAAGAGRR